MLVSSVVHTIQLNKSGLINIKWNRHVKSFLQILLYCEWVFIKKNLPSLKLLVIYVIWRKMTEVTWEKLVEDKMHMFSVLYSEHGIHIQEITCCWKCVTVKPCLSCSSKYCVIRSIWHSLALNIGLLMWVICNLNV